KQRWSAQATAHAQWSRRSTVVSTELSTLHRGLSAAPLFRLTSQRSTLTSQCSTVVPAQRLSAAPLSQCSTVVPAQRLSSAPWSRRRSDEVGAPWSALR